MSRISLFIVWSFFFVFVTTANSEELSPVWQCQNTDGLQAKIEIIVSPVAGGRVSFDGVRITYQSSSIRSQSLRFDESEIFDSRNAAVASVVKEYGSAYGKLVLNESGTGFAKTAILSSARNQLLIYDYETQEEWIYSDCKPE